MGISSLDLLQSAWAWASGLHDAGGEAPLISATLPVSRRPARPWLRRVFAHRGGRSAWRHSAPPLKVCYAENLPCRFWPRAPRSVSCLHFPLFLAFPSLHRLWHVLFSALSSPSFLYFILLRFIFSRLLSFSCEALSFLSISCLCFSQFIIISPLPFYSFIARNKW